MKNKPQKLDLHALLNTRIPDPRGRDGDHPLVEKLRRQIHAGDVHGANIHFDKLVEAHHGKKDFAFLEQIRDKSIPAPKPKLKPTP